MGLEAINYSYWTKNSLELLRSYDNFSLNPSRKNEGTIKSNNYWIDVKVFPPSEISIRITLCNSDNAVIQEIDRLFDFLLNKHKGVLRDMVSKKDFTVYNNEVKESVLNSYFKKKEIFKEMYGNVIAPIGSEEFYKTFPKPQ